MALLTVKDLAIGYDSEIVAGGISFEVNAGDYICIIGENGSGKTTLMKTLLGLARPVSGQIIPGEGIKRNEIGYLPQQTLVQRDFPASVREVVLSGCLGSIGWKPFYGKTEKQTVRRNMERMGITELADRCYRELSGGQQQRVLLARALCATERILLLDEPVTGLDPKVTTEMYELIRELNQDGIAIIMISHDVGASIMYASHILHIGKTIWFGKREDYVISRAGRTFLGGEEDGQ